MANIPFDPHLNELPDQTIPEVRVAIAAAGAENRNNARSADQMVDVVTQGVKWQQKRVEKGFQSDMIVGRSKVKELRAARDRDLAAIPMTAGVDYQKEADKIAKNYNGQWSEWSAKNIRNQDLTYVQDQLQDADATFSADSEYSTALHKADYDERLNLSNLDLALKAAVDGDDSAAIAENTKARVEQGLLSPADAADLQERSQVKADGVFDDGALARADVALLDGNLEAYDAQIDSLRGKKFTIDEKRTLKRKGKTALSYNKTNEIFSVTHGTEGLKELSKGIESKKIGQHMSASQKASMTASINGRLRSTERSQARHRATLARNASKGLFDSESFEVMVTDDTADGLGLGNEEAEIFRSSLIAATESKAKGEATKAMISKVKGEKSYKSISSKITKGLLSPEEFDESDVLATIREKKMHPVVEAELVSETLAVADAKYQEEGEFDSNWLWGFGGREVQGEEKQVLEEYVTEWRNLVKLQGAHDSLGAEFKSGIEKIRAAYSTGQEVNPEALRKQVFSGALKSTMRGEVEESSEGEGVNKSADPLGIF